MLHLSKSKFCNAVQCPKMLWLEKNMPEVEDLSVMNETILNNGSYVGDLAMELLGDFTEVPYGDLSEMIAETSRLLEVGTDVIAEASFAYNSCFCSVDILKNLGNKRVELYEVKSSTHVNDIYHYDVAYQVWVLTKLGYAVEKACLVHINNSYVRHGELDLNQLFTIADMTEVALTAGADVESRINALEQYMKQTEEPAMPLGEQCSSPYNCKFWKYCSRALPTPNVFDISGFSAKNKACAYLSGFISFEDVLKNVKLSEKVRQQVDFTLNNRPDFVDKKAIAKFLKQLSYPLYFLDFESFQPPVPQFDDSRPYQQIVFQYSLHIIEAENGELRHSEFLAEPEGDPRRALAEQLCKDIPLNVCTTAYNMSFEKTQIKGLSELYPDLHDHLMNIHDHIVDLMIPFRNRWYYSKDMQGSYSIKYVLPALYPNDPELDYHNLEGVHKGDEASAAFSAMAHMTPEEQAKTRESLLKYCGLDTLAMVKVWEKLISSIA